MTNSKITDEDFLAAAARGDVAIVQTGLDAGLSADSADAYGNTALMMAAARGQRDVVQTLIDAGAHAGHKNKFGLGPRQWAAWAENQGPIRQLLG